MDLKRETFLGLRAFSFYNQKQFIMDTCPLPGKELTRKRIAFHKTYGLVKLGVEEIVLFSTKHQQSHNRVTLNEVMEVMESQNSIILGVNLMYFFLQNENLIPQRWNLEQSLFGSTVYFLGDIFEGNRKRTVVYGITKKESDSGSSWVLFENGDVKQNGFSSHDKFAILKPRIL